MVLRNAGKRGRGSAGNGGGGEGSAGSDTPVFCSPWAGSPEPRTMLLLPLTRSHSLASGLPCFLSGVVLGTPRFQFDIFCGTFQVRGCLFVWVGIVGVRVWRGYVFVWRRVCSGWCVCVRACVQAAGVQCRDRWVVVWAGYGQDMDGIWIRGWIEKVAGKSREIIKNLP